MTNLARRVSLLVLVGYVSLMASVCMAADVDADEVLSNFPDTKWFDSATNTYLPPSDEPLRDNVLRHEGRVAGPARSWDWWDAFDWDWWDSSATGGGGGAIWGETFLTYFFYSLLFILFIAIVALLTWFLLRDTFPALKQRKKGESSEIVIDRARIEALPFEAKPDMGDPLAMAKHFLAGGQHDKALVYLYGYMLLAMDQRRHIYLQKGKTNRMYLAEIGIQELRQVVRPVQLAFEASFFGKHPVGDERFMEIWGTLDTFHELAAREPVVSDGRVPAMGVVA